MSAKLILTREVEYDLDETYGWYEDRRSGLGEDFLTCVDARLQSICRMPESYPVVYKGVRQALMRRFPFMVLFDWQGDTVTVYAILHTARDSSKWKKRLPE